MGISESKGSFIAFLDADDIWTNNKLSIVDQFTRGTNAGLVCHSYTEAPVFCSGTSTIPYVAASSSIYSLLLRNPAQTSCAVIRKQHALAFDESMRHCEDYDLWLRIAEDFPVLRLVGEPLARLGRPQLSAGGLSGNRVAMRIGEARVYYNFCRRAWVTRAWLLPGLLFFSMLKYVYSYLRRCT
jgi:glycosyltransferase involved in cell wall biosynthesis